MDCTFLLIFAIEFHETHISIIFSYTLFVILMQQTLSQALENEEII
jgi:hypothetical protein